MIAQVFVKGQAIDPLAMDGGSMAVVMSVKPSMVFVNFLIETAIMDDAQI